MPLPVSTLTTPLCPTPSGKGAGGNQLAMESSIVQRSPRSGFQEQPWFPPSAAKVETLLESQEGYQQNVLLCATLIQKRIQFKKLYFVISIYEC